MSLLVKLVLTSSFLLAMTAANAQTTADSTNLKAYAGSYTFASGSPLQKFTITAEKGDLYGEADSYGKNKLVKQAKADTYQSTSSYGSMIIFARDAATKAITGLTMVIQGTELSAKKD
jgi:hypothetical protein